MLVLTRRRQEKVVIDGRISVTILEVQGRKVRLGIDAPDEVPVRREELQEKPRQHCRPAGPQVGPLRSK